MDTALLIALGILALNLVISILNAVTVGKAWVETKAAGGWARFMAWMGFLMSAFGFTWCYAIGLAFLALLFHWLDLRAVEAMLNLTYLLVIPGVVFAGIMITLDSWAYFWRRRTLGSFGVAGYNTFADIYNIYHAMDDVPAAFGNVLDFFGGGDSDEDTGKLILVVLLVLIALFGGFATTWAIVHRVAASKPLEALAPTTR